MMDCAPAEAATWRPSKGDDIHRKLRGSLCVPTRRYLWVPADEIEFVPALSPRIYGDGRALIGLTTIHSRPAFYVIRVDSRWTVAMDMNAPDDAPEFVEFYDDICAGLEEDFGDAWADEEEEDLDILANGNPWPAFDDRDGACWWRMEWPKLRSLQFQPHPYTWRGNLLVTA